MESCHADEPADEYSKSGTRSPPSDEVMAPLNLKISADILCVISGDVILLRTAAESFDSLPAGPVLRDFIQYSVAFCSRPEVAIDVKGPYPVKV